jgi:cell division transport system permease protein
MSYQLQQMWLAMVANLTATLATLTTMTLTLAMLGAVSLTILNLQNILGHLASQVQIAAFLSPHADARQVFAELQSSPSFAKIRSARLVTKQQILAQMSAQYPYLKDAALLVSNPFPNTIRIRLKDPIDTTEVAKQVGKLPGVHSVEYGAGYVTRAVRVIDAAEYVGDGLVILLLINSVFNVLTTVRVGIYARRDEIAVMRLLGAGRGFIQTPYLLEGLLLGLLAGGITALGLGWLYRSSIGSLQQLLPALPLLGSSKTVNELLEAVAGLGIVLGVAASWMASRRYLRELS